MSNSKLYNICKEIAIVEDKLAYGEIDFSYDKLMCAMKSGHPADILDDILSIIGWDVNKGIEPSIKKLEETLEGLKDFQATFKVNLKKQIKDLQSYIKEKREI